MIDLRGDETTSLQAFDRGIPLENGAQYLALILQNASLVNVPTSWTYSLEVPSAYELSFRCRDL
jgi:hypothetical protein